MSDTAAGPLAGRGAVVTGGARGIGLAIARRLAQDGARLAIWEADEAEAARVAPTLPGGGAVAVACDVTDEASVARAASATREALGAHASVLVNNAGITGPNAPVEDYAPADWRRVLEVDLTGPFLCCRALVPGMREAGWGRVVNVASVAGKEGNPNAAAYSAAKAGLIALTKSLGKELAATGVLANCVTPAAVKTDLFAQMTEQHIAYMLSKIPMGRFGLAEEVAEMVAWLAGPSCSFSTGAVFDLSGGRATY